MNKKKRLNILSLLLVMAFSMLGLLASAVLILNSVKTPITVITGSASGIYSSESLSCDEYKIRGLDEEYSAKVTVYGSRRDVGTSQNLADVRIYDSLGIDVTFLFEIEFEYGELTVNPAKLVIRSDSAERKYNGGSRKKLTALSREKSAMMKRYRRYFPARKPESAEAIMYFMQRYIVSEATGAGAL